MPVVAAGVVPAAPVLVPELAPGIELDELREACAEVVRRVCEARRPVVVVGAADRTGPYEGSWDWRGLGLALPAQPAPRRLPLALGVGAWLLRGHGTVECTGVSAGASAEECLQLGRELASAREELALLVCADGSATRSEAAPGHFHPDAADFDRVLESALLEGDLARLGGLEPGRAAAVRCGGLPALQVLSGAVGNAPGTCSLLFRGAPFGVFYLAGTWAAATGAR